MNDRIHSAIVLLFTIAGAVLLMMVGWYSRGDTPHDAARCRASGYIRFVADGDYVIVRCAP